MFSAHYMDKGEGKNYNNIPRRIEKPSISMAAITQKNLLNVVKKFEILELDCLKLDID